MSPSATARTYQGTYSGRSVWRWLVLAQCRCREAIPHLLGFFKPNAIDRIVVVHRPDGLDRHDRAAGLEPDNIARIKGLIAHNSKSPADDSQKRESFSTADITPMGKGDRFQDSREPQLRLGDIVQLNSGSPRMMVVDTEMTAITTAWRDATGKAQETELPPACLHRVTPL